MGTIKVSFDPSSFVNSDIRYCVQRLYVVPYMMVPGEANLTVRGFSMNCFLVDQ